MRLIEFLGIPEMEDQLALQPSNDDALLGAVLRRFIHTSFAILHPDTLILDGHVDISDTEFEVLEKIYASTHSSDCPEYLGY